MISIGLFPKLKKKGSSDDSKSAIESAGSGRQSKKKANPTKRNLQFDLFAQLSYMSAIATTGISRSELFTFAGSLPYATARYFKTIDTFAQKLNTDYAESCRMVAERTKEGDVRSLLLRMAGALSSGEDEAQFLAREAEFIGESYTNLYERDIEGMKKWTDAYVTLLVASGLIVIVAVISMMIYDVGVAIIIGLAMVMVFATCLGAWIIYVAAPREVKTRIQGPSSKLQLRAMKVLRITIPLAAMSAALLLLFGFGLGVAMIAAAIILFPGGWIIVKDDKNIAKKDADIPTVVRVLGGVTAAMGTTVSEATGRIDKRSMGSLMPEVTRLHNRLKAGIDPDICWKELVKETGSELIDRTIEMFWNPMRLGGDPQKVGMASAYFSSRISFMRATRSMVATTFTYLALPLHIAMVGLLLFIVEIMKMFSKTIAESRASVSSGGSGSDALDVSHLLTFGQVDLGLVSFLVTFVVLVLTGANAYAPKAAEGGNNYKVVFNLSIMMTITGVLMIIIPLGAQAVFASVMEQ